MNDPWAQKVGDHLLGRQEVGEAVTELSQWFNYQGYPL